MIRRLVIGGCLLAVLAPVAVAAEENAPIARGRAGLVPVHFRARNVGVTDMSCAVALAHWYSQALGSVPQGGSIEATLWFDPEDGSVLMLNGLEDHMPVQQLWCGAGPEAWTRRAVIRLERKPGDAPAPIDVACRPDAQRLVCR